MEKITLQGKCCKDVVIYTQNVEDEAMSLIYGIANHPVFENAKIRIMPDTHAGKGIVIGFTCGLNDYVNPSHVGCDIGCSMTTMLFDGKLDSKDYAEIEHKIRKAVPTGFDLQEKKAFDNKEFYRFMNAEMRKAKSAWSEMVDYDMIDERYVSDMLKRVSMDATKFYKSIGTVGGGNHFIEYGEYDSGSAWTIHCGSRNFGLKVFSYWEKIAKDCGFTKNDIRTMTHDFKKSYDGDMRQFKENLDKYISEKKKGHYEGYLSGDAIRGYITDLFFAQAYAKFNHKVISELIFGIVRKFGLDKIKETVYTTHNYINPVDHVIRKGAISSYTGENMVIPFNMRDGLAICTGKSNDDWNCSAPHGAGRLMSRSKAKETVGLDEFVKSMEGIYSTSVGRGTLDESPMAYKDCDEIMRLIEPTAEILFLVKPKINIKAFDCCE